MPEQPTTPVTTGEGEPLSQTAPADAHHEAPDDVHHEAPAEAYNEAYRVRLAAFEGPMDLLMHLIDKNKIDIYDIPIAELAQQYLDYLDKFREFKIDIASEFLVMAATLLQIKVRYLLPRPPKEADDLGEVYEDPRRELVESILEYRRIKKVSAQLSELAAEQEKYFTRQPADLPTHHLPPARLELKLLVDAFCAALAIPEEPTIPEALVTPEEWNIQDKMADIIARLTAAPGQLRFSEVFRFGTRPEIIATFLALLELIKTKAIHVRQNHLFADIYITLNPNTSAYIGSRQESGASCAPVDTRPSMAVGRRESSTSCAPADTRPSMAVEEGANVADGGGN